MTGDDPIPTNVHLRSQLIEYDPGLAAMCREVFGETALKYTVPPTKQHP